MATKSKNNAIAASVRVAVCGLAAFALLSLTDIVKHAAFLNPQYYFHSEPFYRQLELNFNVIKYIKIDNRNYPQLSADNKIGPERLKMWQQEEDRLAQEKAKALQRDYGVKLNNSRIAGNEELTNRLLQAE